jgi:hypothetical protein
MDRVKGRAESRSFFKRNTLNAPYFFSFGQDGDSPSLGRAVSAAAGNPSGGKNASFLGKNNPFGRKNSSFKHTVNKEDI